LEWASSESLSPSQDHDSKCSPPTLVLDNIVEIGIFASAQSECDAHFALIVERENRSTMPTFRSEVIHTSILARPEDVVAFLRDVSRWTTWAPWVRSASPTAPNAWALDTDTGRMTIDFVEPNANGVLDHRVTLESGLTVVNSMRVLANGAGSELVMVLLQQPGVSTEEFERDVRAVREDLVRIKAAAE
jgi:hypothetical protein